MVTFFFLLKKQNASQTLICTDCPAQPPFFCAVGVRLRDTVNGRHPVAVDVASHRKERLELRFLAVVNILVAPISYIKNGLVCLNSHNIQAAPSDPKVPHSYATRLVQPVVRVWKGALSIWPRKSRHQTSLRRTAIGLRHRDVYDVSLKKTGSEA